MSALRRSRGDVHGESADKAFWISFADLMTALMVLFLTLMIVALMAITRSQMATRSESESKSLPPSPRPSSLQAEHLPSGPDARAVQMLMTQVAHLVETTPGVSFDAQLRVIDFGDRARFQTGSHELDAASARLLREFVPRLLEVTESQAGRQWVSRVVVEGFADFRGDYLYNLNLSLQRGQRVLCALLEPAQDGSALSPAHGAAVQDIFAVGGFSFNEQRESLDASRRIELRVEFGPRPPHSEKPQARSKAIGHCSLPGGTGGRPVEGRALTGAHQEAGFSVAASAPGAPASRPNPPRHLLAQP